MPHYVICTDGSLCATNALHFAANLTTEQDVITILRIIQPSNDFATAGARMEDARTSVENASLLFTKGTVTRNVLQTSDAVADTVIAAYDGNCDVIIAGTRGRGALRSAVFGSVSFKLVTQCSNSAVLIVPNCSVLSAADHVTYICMCDGSNASLRAVNHVSRMLRAQDSVEFVACVPADKDCEEELRSVWSAAQQQLSGGSGPVHHATCVSEFGKVPTYAAQQRAWAAGGVATIVVGSRGLSTLGSLVVGSTTSILAHAAKFPLLVVRTPTSLSDVLTDEWNGSVLRVGA